jgi:hypothetical protein
MSNTAKSEFQNLFTDIKDYTKIQIDLTSLRLAEKSAIALSSFISILISILFLSFAFLFGSMSLAYALSNDPNQLWKGFAMVAGGFLVPGLFILIFKKRFISRPLTDLFIRKFLNQPSDES